MNEPSPAQKVSQKYGKPNQIGQLVTPEEIETFEPELKEKLTKMILNKEQAISEDDFDRAVALRNGIEFIRDKAREFKNCLRLKLVAIENEDYEVAKRYKHRIEAER